MILPDPDSHFVWRQTAEGPALLCPALDAVAEHFFTTRHWSLGRQPASGRAAETGWVEIAAAMRIPQSQLARARQVHGAAVVVAAVSQPDPSTPLPEGDILLARPPLGCAIQTADCLPLLLADQRSGMVAAAHAGWRGLSLRVPQLAVAAMVTAAGAEPADLLVAIGPAIGPCCYEVGEDVREAFRRAGFDRTLCDGWFLPKALPTPRNPSFSRALPIARPAHAYFNMWSAAREQLTAAGVPPQQIYSADLCTASHAGAFCSYRRDGTGVGRLAAAIRSRRG